MATTVCNSADTLLDFLGIEYGVTNLSGYTSIICPFHDDRNLGSAFLNIVENRFHCFSCGESTSLIGVIRRVKKCSYDEASYYTKNFDVENVPQNASTKPRGKKLLRDTLFFDPDLLSKPRTPCEYLRLRGYTLEYLRTMHAGITDLYRRYRGYLLTPIVSDKLNIRTFEGRKIYQREVYDSLTPEQQQFYDIHQKSLRLQYNRETEVTQVLLNKEVIKSSPSLVYLLLPKVLYPRANATKYTLFNYDNLIHDEALYIVEGLSSIPKIYTHISQNVTCTFGSQVTDTQLELFKAFKSLVLIPDNDQAGHKWTGTFRTKLPSSKIDVINTTYEDTDKEYVSSIPSSVSSLTHCR